MRAGRYGPYVQLGRAEELNTKPRTGSLLSGMSPEEVTLDEALRVLTLPRSLGKEQASREDIVADNGRYGPYVRRGSEYRSLENEAQLFTVTLDEALALFSQPRTRRSRQAAEPLAEIGPDPVSGAPIVVKEGRFGPYVTDGTVNASLRRGDTAEALTLERAAELLAERRARVGAEADRTGTGTRTGGRAGRASKTAAGRRPARSRTGAGSSAAKSTGTKKKAAASSTAKATPRSTGATKAGAQTATKAGASKAGATKAGATKAGATKASASKASASKAGASKAGAAPQNPLLPANRQRQSPGPATSAGAPDDA